MPERGFTLLEIMLVIFLIGLASAGVVQTFATASEPPAKKAAEPVVIAAPEPIVPPAAPNETEDKHPALKKGKKS